MTQNTSLTHALPDKPALTAALIKPTCNPDADKRRTDNTPAWVTKAAKFQEDKISNKPRAVVISARVILVGENVPNLCAMHLSVINVSAAPEFRLVDCDANEVPCRFELDRCNSMNTVNILVHQWLVTKYPAIFDSYEQFDDTKPFRKIILAGALDNDDTEDFESGKLTAVVTYKTCYTKVDGTPVKVSFGL